MNSDSESLQHQLLAWFLASDAEAGKHPSAECEEIDGVENPLFETTTSTSGDFESEGIPQTFQLGEIPTVQERFQAVIKRRLQVQIQDHPPLFPWETQLKDYPDYVDSPSVALVPAYGWMAQQSKLNIPVSLPEKVFRQLLEKCQAMLVSSLPLGAKLVQVVESLFPNDAQALNDLAGMVLRSPSRSVGALEKMPIKESDYSDLGKRQQMALSLLAAKQLLENLTLPISDSNPAVEREWLTSAGAINLKVEYQSQGRVTKLCVMGELPTAGILTLQGNGTQARTMSSTSGCVSVELYGQPLNQTYTLSVEFPELEQQSLLFVILPMM
ncbi:PatU [Tolypothrix sp. VBCCA 56010]|uniref:PatU n=1 Tax=Tolypothrix sp. VBCCA 56010 TaxID=3137731 RepID=UPI003D7F0BA7